MWLIRLISFWFQNCTCIAFLDVLIVYNWIRERRRSYVRMPSTTVTFSDSDVVRLVLEFLSNRDLHISMLSLERETGVINGVFSDDLLFLRQLILDGQWDDVIDFVQPLTAIPDFDMNRFRFAVSRHQYLELLCVRGEAAQGCDAIAVDEVVQCLSKLEPVCPSREEYNRLCLLLTTSRLADHPEYAGWNPSSARVQCFTEIRPLVEHLLPVERTGSKCNIGVARDDRMIQLLVKGLLYESCVEFCQREATDAAQSTRETPALLSGAGLDDAEVVCCPGWKPCHTTPSRVRSSSDRWG